eukprot:1570321-Rhodomonas_salina.1
MSWCSASRLLFFPFPPLNPFPRSTSRRGSSCPTNATHKLSTRLLSDPARYHGLLSAPQPAAVRFPASCTLLLQLEGGCKKRGGEEGGDLVPGEVDVGVAHGVVLEERRR